ncbi:hypothetical protein SAMN05216525_12324 [Bradyrhizobium sp. Gha]|nr:hypothetical protein SAMN05216525_12324 [Bradyrhizobium sp. Gha]
MIDTSIVRVHQHGACITRNRRQSMGRSRGGLTSKIHAVVDSNGLPVRLALSPGEAHDVRRAGKLLSRLKSGSMPPAERSPVFASASLQLRRTPRFAPIGPARLRPLGSGAAAFARFASDVQHRLAWPKLAKRAKAGGPGRTRTCNQTVMSGRLSTSLVDFAAFSLEFDCVRRGLFTSFLVRNWCGR